MNAAYMQLTIGNAKLRQVTFSEGKPLHFRVQKNTVNFRYLWRGILITCWAITIGAFKVIRSFELTMDQKEVYLTMQQLFKRFEEPTNHLSKSGTVQLVYGKVLPHLRKIGTVEITKEVGAEIQESPFSRCFFTA